MERYGRVSEGSQTDPPPEWTTPGAETGLEEAMWQLGLGAGAGVESYPERPSDPDCIHYLRTGFCGYGARCRFNHPRDRAAVLGSARALVGEYPERPGQAICQYYMRTGTCKFGASCKYHHPRQGVGSVSNAPLNIHGYPLRPGEKECSYYVKTGQCKFGATCKFHHPQFGSQVPAPTPTPHVAPAPSPVPGPALYQTQTVPSAQQFGVVIARPPMLPGSYVQGPYGPVLLSPSMVPLQGWNPYAAPVNTVAPATTQPSMGSSSIYALPQFSGSNAAFAGSYQPLPTTVGPSSSSQKEFPERPGQPECQFYMKTGDCKFGSSCRYHHPPEVVVPKSDVALSPSGLPLRPGAPPCTHYAQRGECKFGAACKFDHPMGTLSYSPSASSLADMPVAPYPVGASIGTLAPSSSSSDLRPELISGSSKDTVPTRMSSTFSSSSGSSGSVGSIYSKSGPVSVSNLQQSGQSSSPTTTITSSSTEARTSS